MPSNGRADLSATYGLQIKTPPLTGASVLKSGNLKCREPSVPVPDIRRSCTAGEHAEMALKFGPGFPERRFRWLSVEFGKFPDGELMSLAPARGERITAKSVASAVQPRRLVRAAICGVLLIAATSVGAADAHNPYAGDPKAAKAGEYEFRINCALCHGLGAHGGGRGPDLTRAQKKHAHSDGELFSGDQQRHSGDGHAGERYQRPGRRHDRRRDLADHHIYPQRRGEVRAQSLGQCGARQGTFLWRRELLALPYGRG